MSEQQAKQCAFEDCSCTITAENMVEHDGKQYCSERCVDNRGCDHEGCNCGAFPTAEKAPLGDVANAR